VLSPFSTEAGLKYFILGSFASGLLLLGLSFIYLSCGTLNFEDLTLLLYTTSIIPFQNNLIILGIVFIIGGLFFKLGIAPFHM
jgi:NADH-quinone oxidoreductase subunit N